MNKEKQALLDKCIRLPFGAPYVVDEYDGFETLYWSMSEIKNC